MNPDNHQKVFTYYDYIRQYVPKFKIEEKYKSGLSSIEVYGYDKDMMSMDYQSEFLFSFLGMDNNYNLHGEYLSNYSPVKDMVIEKEKQGYKKLILMPAKSIDLKTYYDLKIINIELVKYLKKNHSYIIPEAQGLDLMIGQPLSSFLCNFISHDLINNKNGNENKSGPSSGAISEEQYFSDLNCYIKEMINSDTTKNKEAIEFIHLLWRDAAQLFRFTSRHPSFDATPHAEQRLLMTARTIEKIETGLIDCAIEVKPFKDMEEYVLKMSCLALTFGVECMEIENQIEDFFTNKIKNRANGIGPVGFIIEKLKSGMDEREEKKEFLKWYEQLGQTQYMWIKIANIEYFSLKEEQEILNFVKKIINSDLGQKLQSENFKPADWLTARLERKEISHELNIGQNSSTKLNNKI